MKKTLLTAALMAATIAPVAAQAQDHRGHDRDRREWRDDRRDWREDRRDWRQDRREDWRSWRQSHRNDFRRGTWRAPFQYRRFDTGMVLPRPYWSSRYYVNNWSAYRLPAPGNSHFRYVRHYDDLLLVNIVNGRVVQVYRGFYW